MSWKEGIAIIIPQSACIGLTPTHLLQSTAVPEGALPGDTVQKQSKVIKQIIPGDTTLTQNIYAPSVDYF